MSEPREYTTDEVREIFLDHVRGLVDYWDKSGGCNSQKERLEGLAFSILVTLDGCDGNMPAFDLIPDPHEDDKDYHRKNGDNWFPNDCDIGEGELHERFYRKQ